MGVAWVLPPKGISTVPAPMVASNRSARPLRLHTFNSLIKLANCSSKPSPGRAGADTLASPTRAVACFFAPLLFKNSRLISQMVRPFQRITRRGFSATTATGVASRFSSFARAMNSSTSLLATTTAMRSWLSLMASSVPSRPSYFLGTAFRSITLSLIHI